MNMIIISLLITIIILLIIIWIASTYNHFQDYLIRIGEAEENIDATLRKRFDLLNKSISIIKNIADETSDISLGGLTELRSKKLNNFELDRALYESINEFNSYKDKFSNLKDDEDIIKISISLSSSEIEMVASRKYYNDVITDYNKIIKTFPSNLVGKFSKLKEKNYFGNDKENVKL